MSDTTNNRNKWLHIRLNEKEHKQINNRFEKTTCRKLSDYARRVLLDRQITTLTRNQSLDDFMAEMIQLRKELNAIGNNFNQAVKKLHTLDHIPEFRTWAMVNETGKQTLFKKVEEIKNKIGQIADQWLQ